MNYSNGQHNNEVQAARWFGGNTGSAYVVNMAATACIHNRDSIGKEDDR